MKQFRNMAFATLLLAAGVCRAQTDSSRLKPPPQQLITATLGTNGLGLAYTRHAGPKLAFTLQGGYRFFQAAFSQQWAGSKVLTVASSGSPVAGVLAQWYAFRKEGKKAIGQALHLKMGLVWLAEPQYRFESGLKDGSVSWGSISFSREEIGSITTTVKPSSWQPLLALGYQPDSKKKIKMGFDAGVLYQGKPRVQMEATRMLRETVSQAPVLEQNLDSYRWMPYLSINGCLRL